MDLEWRGSNRGQCSSQNARGWRGPILEWIVWSLNSGAPLIGADPAAVVNSRGEGANQIANTPTEGEVECRGRSTGYPECPRQSWLRESGVMAFEMSLSAA